MKINSINRFNQPAFKSNITFDIGGSQREGSCKISYTTSDNSSKIYEAKTTVNSLGKKQFVDSEDFVSKIVEKVNTVQKNNFANIKDMGFGMNENIIKSMTIFIPSYTSYRHVFYLPNHKDAKDRPLKDIDFSNIENLLKESKVLVDPNMKFRVFQDSMGTGLAVAKKLYNNDLLSKGKYYTACITGGGCGVANIEMTDDENVIIKTSGSGYLSESSQLVKVSRAGASAPAVIRNFCRAFGLNEEMVEDITSCHKAEFTLTNPVEYNKDVKTLKLKSLLLATGKYECEDIDDKKFVLKVKQDYEDLYNRSRRNAIDKYCHAFARFAIIKKNEGSNGLVITGPLAKAINESAKENYNKNIPEWVTDHLFSSYNTYELDKVQEVYDFKVFCDSRFDLKDNTACEDLAHKAELVSPERGNWVKVNINDLKD